MGKAGGIIGLIAGIFGVLGAAATLIFGGIGHAIGAEGASSVVGYGWGGVAFSFLVVVLSAMAIAQVRHAGIAMVAGSILGMAFGGWLVAICMFLALVGGVFAIIGQTKRPRVLANGTSETPQSSKAWLLWVLLCVSGLLAAFLLLQKPTKSATAPDPIAELTKAPTSELRPDGELADVFALGGSNTNLQRDNKLKEIRGQTVQWQLPVYEVSRADDGFKVQTQSDIKFGQIGKNVIGAFVYLKPRNDEDRRAIEALKTGDVISFKGRIADISLRSLEIKPAILWRDRDRISSGPAPEIAAAMPPPATARTVSQITLEAFECGDVCHLRYRDASGSTTSVVCVDAGRCREWASAPASFASFIGTRADLVIGRKFIAEGGVTVDSVVEVIVSTSPTPATPTSAPSAPSTLTATPAAMRTAEPNGCSPGAKQVFVCVTQAARKRIEVCASSSTVSYTFGRPGNKPDMAVAVPKAMASGFSWTRLGMGNAITSINVPTGNTEYRVYKNIERDPNGKSWAGVHVVVNGKQVADVECDMSTEKSDLESVDLKPADEW